MADNKIKVAGTEVDLGEFARAARNNINNWMLYQGITDAEKETYLNTFNDYLDGLVSGKYELDDTGAFIGADKSISYTGAITGAQKDGPVARNGMKRNSRNLGGNIVSFFNGLADKFRQKQTKTSTEKEDNAAKSAWSTDWVTKDALSRIFGNAGLSESTINSLWLDKENLGSDGKRDTTYRRGILNQIISDYKNKIDTGYFGDSLSEDEKARQLSYVTSALNGDYSVLLGPYFTSDKLMTTNGKYFQDPNSEAALAWRRENGEPQAGYTEELWALKLKDDEAKAKADADKAYEDEMMGAFNGLTYTGSQVRGQQLLPVFNSFTDVTTDFLLKDPFTSMWALANGAYSMGPDYSTDGRGLDIAYGSFDMPFEMGHDDWMSRDNIDMRNEIPDAYLRRNELNPDEVYWSNVKDYKAGRSANAYRAKYLADYLANYYSTTPDTEELSTDETGNTFIIPSSIDWTNLKVLLYKRGNGAQAYIQEIDLPSLINLVKELNPALYNRLLNSYLEFYRKKHPRKNKNGGIIKALAGTAFKEYLNPIPVNELIKTSHEEAIAKGGVKNYQRDKRNEEVNFTATDWARIGTMAGDIVSAASAFIPVYGTAASAITGVGATVGNLAIDLKDPSVSTGEALGGLATGLALDVVGLIPGLGTAGKLSKIAKVAASLGPKILVAFTAMGAAPGATTAMKKLISGEGSKITVGEWKDLAHEISALSGATRMGRASYLRNKTFAGAKETSVENGKFKVKTANGEKEVTLTMDEIKAANKAGFEGGNEKAIEIINSSADAKSKGIVATELPTGVNFKSSKVPGVSRMRSTGLKENNTVVTPGTSSDYAKLNRVYRIGALRNQNPLIRFAGRNLATDFDMYQLQMNGALIASPFRNGTGITLPGFKKSNYYNTDQIKKEVTPEVTPKPEVFLDVTPKPVSNTQFTEPTKIASNDRTKFFVNLPDNAVISNPSTGGAPIKVMKVTPTLNIKYPSVSAIEFEQITGTLPSDFHAAYRLPDGTILWWKKGGKVLKFYNGGNPGNNTQKTPKFGTPETPKFTYLNLDIYGNKYQNGLINIPTHEDKFNAIINKGVEDELNNPIGNDKVQYGDDYKRLFGELFDPKKGYAYNLTPNILTAASLYGINDSLGTNKRILDRQLDFRSPFNVTPDVYTRLFDPYNIRQTADNIAAKTELTGRQLAERSSDIQAGNAARLNANSRVSDVVMNAATAINQDLRLQQTQRDGLIQAWTQQRFKDINTNNQISSSDLKLRNNYRSAYEAALHAARTSALQEFKSNLARNAYNDLQYSLNKEYNTYMDKTGGTLLKNDLYKLLSEISRISSEKSASDANYDFDKDPETVQLRNDYDTKLRRFNELSSYAMNQIQMNTPRMNNWSYGNIHLLDMKPSYQTPYMNWDNSGFNFTMNKKGGKLTTSKSKMAEAERLKNRRHQSKLEYDVMKFINEDSRKRIHGMSGEMNTLIKKIMGA